MLPLIGTAARDALRKEAAAIGINALREDGNIPDALYAVYTAFRVRFLEERGLMDVVAGRSTSSVEALVDARVIEADLCAEWASLILEAAGDEGDRRSIGGWVP